MSTPFSKTALTQARARLHQRWRELAERERLLLGIAAAALGLLLFWQLGVAPAWRTLRSTPALLDQADQQLQLMRAQAQEASTLRAQPAVSAAQAQQVLSAAAGRLGDGAELSIQGPRAVLKIRDLPGPVLMDWLAEVRQAARIRPQEAQLQLGPKGYSGRITLGLEE
ncbi:type II secretion system protein M [Pelomonas sp. CA6]|uniref:type II secretion system protein GspM n=1 Tax=Pelomonas sp. CA6 TaxID=2907999 RepID=UPI001F4BEE1B|nr:type II secretion system protein GspM [Pelomonas sp. CA6]MCH7343265.1 type II secretion system protein M [Pelomonas sp. CA6]